MDVLRAQSKALQRVIDHDEQLVGIFPAIALPIYTAIPSGESFDQPEERPADCPGLVDSQLSWGQTPC